MGGTTTIAIGGETEPAQRAGWWGLLGLLLLSGASAFVSVRYTRFEAGVSAMWIANGLIVGVLLVRAKSAWPACLLAGGLGQVAARLVAGDPWPMTVALTAVNLGECLAVAWWIRRDLPVLAKARSLAKVSKDALASSFLACLLSATLALPVLMTRGDLPMGEAWLTWFSAHLLGLVVVATLTVCLYMPQLHLRGGRREQLQFLLGLAALVAVCWASFSQPRYPLLFLPWLPLMLLAWRHGLAGVVAGILALAACAAWATVSAELSFANLTDATPLERLVFWQVYMAASCLLAFSSAVALTQMRQLEARLQRSVDAQAATQAQLQAITDHLPALVARFDRDARYLYANEHSRSLVAPLEIIGKTLRELRGEEQYEQLRPHIEAVLRGESPVFDTYLQLENRLIELRAQFVPDRGADGRVQGFYSLAFDISEAKNHERVLEELARFDSLTGLANRRHFEETLEEAVALSIRSGAPLALLALDLDKFKQINDTLGHAAGDEVLKEFARRIQKTVYEVDLVARLGGDEFLVLVRFAPTREGTEKIAAHIVEAMRAPMLIEGREVQAATSIGIGLAARVVSAEALMSLADKALYEAKNRGRNTWAVCET